MKKIEFETSKGKFLIKEYDTFNDLVKDANFYKQKICKLSEITEEQASEIVDEDKDYGVRIFQNYQTTSMQYFDEQITAIGSLHSLLKSKGIHLYENPAPLLHHTRLEAEAKTFYNPYIFKL